MQQRELIVLANLAAQRGPRGGLVLTQKFINGVGEYARHWPGPVATLVTLNATPTSDMDHVEVLPGDVPFQLELRPADSASLANRLRHAAVVLSFLSPMEASTATLCRELGVPLVYYSEYSLKTECQIIDAQTTNPILRWRRKAWAMSAERQRLAAVSIAAGVQCSGTPTYEVYRRVQPNAMLFFDSRVRRADVVDEAVLREKDAVLRMQRPLRLVFGGRLIAMKGVMQLPRVAQALSALHVPYVLDIYGGGVLASQLEQDIARRGLSDRVKLRGVLDFEREWVPLLREQVDLFLCCHPQGDPSSTYPEVMACGVPIAGYDNEAFSGIVKTSGCGWLSPMNDPDRLAAVVARLHADRQQIVAAADRGRRFALDHCFESTFAARTQHLLAASRWIAESTEPVSA